MKVLDIKNVTKFYKKQEVLSGLNLSLEEGFVLGLIGENGVGKTTLMKAIMNLVRLDSGTINVFGKDHLENEKDTRSRIGFVHEASYLFEDLNLLDTERIVHAAYKQWDSRQFRRYLERLQLPTNKKVKTFSKGMKMRAALAIALSHKAELIIMDEPTSGLDPMVRNDLYRVIRDELNKEKRSFIISTHITSDLEKVADYVAILRNGIIPFQVSLDSLREDYAVCKGSLEALSPDREALFLGVTRSQVGFQGLTDNPRQVKEIMGSQAILERPTIEDLMIYTDGGAVI